MLIKELVMQTIRDVGVIRKPEILRTDTLTELGFDSLKYMELRYNIKKKTGIDLSYDSLLGKSVSELLQLCEADNGVFRYDKYDGFKIALNHRRLLRNCSVSSAENMQILTIDGMSLYLPKTANIESVVYAYCETMLPFHPHYYLINPICEDDIVFDCGACEGIFAKSIVNKVRKVYLIEPSEIMCECLSKTFEAEINASKVEIIQAALGKAEGSIDFVDSTLSPFDSFVTEDSRGMGKPVKMMSVDFIMKNRGIPKLDFIKSDIEGEERNMLLGAAISIKTYKPRMAICVYHLPDDPVTISKIITDIRPDYQIHMRGTAEFQNSTGSIMAHCN